MMTYDHCYQSKICLVCYVYSYLVYYLLWQDNFVSKEIEKKFDGTLISKCLFFVDNLNKT